MEGLGKGKASLPGVTLGDRTKRFTLESRPRLGGISEVGVEGIDTGLCGVVEDSDADRCRWVPAAAAAAARRSARVRTGVVGCLSRGLVWPGAGSDSGVSAVRGGTIVGISVEMDLIDLLRRGGGVFGGTKALLLGVG